MFTTCRILVTFFFPVIALSLTTTVSTANGASRNSPLFATSKMVALPSGQLRKAAVCGATGRTGKLVVDELLNRGIDVVAIVRTTEKAESELPCQDPKVTVVKCNLSFEQEIVRAIEGCDVVFWCATGFSDAPTGLVDKLKSLLGIAIAQKKSIDSVGVPAIARGMLTASNSKTGNLPQVIMCSSAGVTRTRWSAAKKTKLAGCADIPIVRLNPVGSQSAQI